MSERLGRTLHDIARTLESCASSEEREARVLELLREVVPYEWCALYHAPPGREPRLQVVPEAPLEVLSSISETIVNLHGLLVDARARAVGAQATPGGRDLAVPLVGDDRVIGVLLVRGKSPHGAPGGYTEQHLSDLSIAGAHLAGYLVILAQARALSESQREAESANRMKDAFLALVSRALKSTLSSTLAWTRILRSEDAEGSGRRKAVEAIERNTDLQAKRIEELLELSCVMAADPHLQLEIVEPDRLIEAAVEGQRERAERKAIRVETFVDKSVGRLVADPARIVRVISSVLANAIQFSASGGQVGVHLARAGAHARIQVIDHGKGIAAEHLSRLFEPFREAGNPLARTYGELGGELAIARPLVEAHGGRIWAESPGCDKGSILTIELPMRAAAANADSHPLAGIRVLVVDDDLDMLFATGMVLEHFGAEVTTAPSATAAFAVLERAKPHVLLSDLMMAKESGYDLIRKVSALPVPLPAAALTASANGEERGNALAAGFRMYLAKPFAVSLLVKAVATLAGRLNASTLETAVIP
jgi:signal transduction histidine kinase/ActR/RegA family two-component response regulator